MCGTGYCVFFFYFQKHKQVCQPTAMNGFGRVSRLLNCFPDVPYPDDFSVVLPNPPSCPQTGSIFTSYHGNVTSGPGIYPFGADCTWIIAPPNVSEVHLIFSRFETEGNAPCCLGDQVWVYQCVDIHCIVGSAGTTLIASPRGTLAMVPPAIISKSGIMRVSFLADWQDSRTGFFGNFHVPCPAGTYGSHMPDCTPCTSFCPQGKVLVYTSCGGVGATANNYCACPRGTYESTNTSACVPCKESCKAGTSFTYLCFFP